MILTDYLFATWRARFCLLHFLPPQWVQFDSLRKMHYQHWEQRPGLQPSNAKSNTILLLALLCPHVPYARLPSSIEGAGPIHPIR